MESNTPGGVRTPLAKQLPLEMPFLIQIFPVYACNFRCGYCIHALSREQHGYISNETFMPFALYKKIIDDIKLSNRKIKMLRFAAIGEPLLHPQIAQMVKYAVDNNVADSVDIVTNGSLLTHELSDKLIEAGLSRLRISLEGLSDEDYLKNSNAKISFSSMKENIEYFYKHKKNTMMYIKIIDYMVQNESSRELFFDSFSHITDSIAIEHLTPTIKEIDYSKLSGNMETNKPQNGEVLLDAKVCPQPFYMMQINPDGNVVPCCSMKYPRILGNVYEKMVQEIWLGEDYNQFRVELLDGVKNMNCECSRCNLYLYDLHEEDNIDGECDSLKNIYQGG